MFYVYIIRSRIDGTLYKGYTEDYLKRILQHNNGESRYTANKVPWDLVYVEVHDSKKSALIRERKLKHANKNYLNWLFQQPSNILKN